MEQNKLRVKLKKINPACVLANHLFGKDHTVHHKMIAGLLLMTVGVVISKSAVNMMPVVHYGADVVGYFLHGMGGIPYGEWLAGTSLIASQQNEHL